MIDPELTHATITLAGHPPPILLDDDAALLLVEHRPPTASVGARAPASARA